MKEQETTNHKPQTVSYNLNINLLPNCHKITKIRSPLFQQERERPDKILRQLQSFCKIG
jgi:hypothetical protein